MIKLIALLTKKPGMSMEDFIEYYERRHVVLGFEMFPEIKKHRRNYRISDPGRSAGSGADYDCVTEVYFGSAADRDAMFRRLAENPDIERRLAADEENLFDRGKMKIFFVEEKAS
jgi:EthD domain